VQGSIALQRQLARRRNRPNPTVLERIRDRAEDRNGLVPLKWHIMLPDIKRFFHDSFKLRFGT
jgi:hypothetical protein